MNKVITILPTGFIPFCYYATLNRVVDGDTINVTIDEGFKHYWTINTRLAHINAPELNSTDPVIKAKAQAAKDYLTQRLPVGTILNIISKQLDDYGRPIVQVYYQSADINQEMIDKGFAVKYM